MSSPFSTPENGSKPQKSSLPPHRRRLNLDALHNRGQSFSTHSSRWTGNEKHHRRPTMGNDVFGMKGQSIKVKPPMTVHPDFENGDAFIICHSPSQSIGFLLPSPILRDSCQRFMDMPIPPPVPIEVEEDAHDIHAFLLFLTNEPSILNLDVWQCAGVQRIIHSWCAKMTMHLALAAYVAVHAPRLISSIGNSRPLATDLIQLLSVAAYMRCIDLWHWILVNIRTHREWREALNPGGLTQADIHLMGQPAFQVVKFLASSGENGVWSGLDDCVICRDATGLFVIIRSIGERQLMYSDNSL